MIYTVSSSNINVKLQQYKQKQHQVEKQMSGLAKAPSGTLNFGYHRLKKESKELQEKITQINSILHPEIIA